MAYDVFISYSRKDIEIIDRIEEELDKYGITSFVDRSEIDLGDDFAEIIAKSLYESEILLFVWSENSNQSENTANEIALAIDFEKTIVSFKIGSFKPHYKLAYRLVRFNRIDAATFNEPQIIELGEKIAKRLGKNQVQKKEMPLEAKTQEEPQSTENPLYETYYQLGAQALLRFNLNTAFSELLEPSLNNYKDSQLLMSRIIQSNTRIWSIDESKFSYVQEKADEGNAFAQYIMARFYGVRKNDAEKQFMYARKGAEQNSPYAIFELSRCYDLGLGTPKNNSKYLEMSRKAISMNNPAAILEMAKNLICGWTVKVDEERALHLLEKGVSLNDPACIAELGDGYWEGSIVPRDIDKAKELINKAISLGYIEGYKSLGDIYLYEPGTYQMIEGNQAKTFELYMKGAECGEPNCLTSIAWCYYAGCAVKENKKNALKWYQKAANAGDRHAYYMVGHMYYYGEEIAEDNALAWEWFEKGREKIFSNCSYMLGIMCLDGYAQQEKSKKDAIAYFEESAFLGGTLGEESMLKLYDIYTEGILTEKDEEKAIKWLKRAAEMKNADASLKYGILLTDMDSPYSNEFKGIKYLQQALDKENYEAAIHLAKLHRQGIGTSKDLEKAKEYFLIAAEKANNAEAYYELGGLYSHASHDDWEEEKEEVDDEQKEKDNQLAMHYFEEAGAMGYIEAYVKMSEMEHSNLDYDDLENCAAGKKIFMWTFKAAEENCPQAILDMGVNYQLGIGTPINIDKAIEWYTKAYKIGDKHAPYNIAELYNSGEFLPRDVVKARYWYSEAERLKNESAGKKLNELDSESYSKVVEWEKSPDMSRWDEYISMVYKEKGYVEENDVRLKNLWKPGIDASPAFIDTDCLPGSVLSLYNAWECLCELLPGLNLKVSLTKVTPNMLYPYCSFLTIRKMREELARLWLALKKQYPEKLLSVSLPDDSNILDLAEAENDGDLSLLLVEIVESNFELEGICISNEKLLLIAEAVELFESNNRPFDEDTTNRILTLADEFYAGTKEIAQSYAMAKEWYEKVPDVDIAKERLAAIKERL